MPAPPLVTLSVEPDAVAPPAQDAHASKVATQEATAFEATHGQRGPLRDTSISEKHGRECSCRALG